MTSCMSSISGLARCGAERGHTSMEGVLLRCAFEVIPQCVSVPLQRLEVAYQSIEEVLIDCEEAAMLRSPSVQTLVSLNGRGVRVDDVVPEVDQDIPSVSEVSLSAAGIAGLELIRRNARTTSRAGISASLRASMLASPMWSISKTIHSVSAKT